VEQIVGTDGQLSAVRLSSGEVIDTPMLIVAVGVQPNSSPLLGSVKGIAGNEQMLADPCIYAAGDVAVTRHAVTGVAGIYANYPNALQQARTAARHLVHGEGSYIGSVNTTVLKKHIDFPVISVGNFSGEAVTWQRGDIWRRVYLQEGMINGYIIIGDTRLSGYLYQLYISRKRVDKTIRTLLLEPGHSSCYREMLGLASA
jgi:nitrite reductase (NADH) large subunit